MTVRGVWLIIAAVLVVVASATLEVPSDVPSIAAWILPAVNGIIGWNIGAEIVRGLNK